MVRSVSRATLLALSVFSLGTLYAERVKESISCDPNPNVKPILHKRAFSNIQDDVLQAMQNLEGAQLVLDKLAGARVDAGASETRLAGERFSMHHIRSQHLLITLQRLAQSYKNLKAQTGLKSDSPENAFTAAANIISASNAQVKKSEEEAQVAVEAVQAMITHALGEALAEIRGNKEAQGSNQWTEIQAQYQKICRKIATLQESMSRNQ